MHQQFVNSPMDNCDPQLCLGQGHFNNLLHCHMGRNQSSAVTSTTNLEDVAALRRIQSVLLPQMTSNNNSCAYTKQPVDASGLKCPIVMMNNPFQRQTDRTTGAAAVEKSAARHIPCVQQASGLERRLLAGSEEAAADTDNNFVQARNPGHGFCHNDASCESTHRVSQHQLVPSSENQICTVPQNICDYAHNNNNEAQITEYDDPYFPNDTHHQGQSVHYQTNPAAHFPPHPAPTHGQRQGQAATNWYPHNHKEPPNGQLARQYPHNHEEPPNGQRPGQYPHNHQQLPNGQRPGQYPHNHEQPPNGQRPEQYPHNHEQPPNRQQPRQYPHNHEEPSNGQRPGQYPHNHEQPPNGLWPGQYPHNYKEPPHSMDLVLYKRDHIQYLEPHTNVAGDVAMNDVGFMAFNPVNDLHRPTHLTSQPLSAAMTTSHYGHHHGGGQVPGPTQGRPTTNQAAFTGNNMPGFHPGAAAYGGCHQLPETRRGFLPNIRRGERFNIQSYLLPGRVLQVHGAPMTGKSTMVRQAISDAISNSAHTGQLHVHHITCKGVARFSDLLNLIAQSWYPQYSRWRQQDTDTVLKLIGLLLQQNPPSHHVLVFHKCENLQENPHGQHFLEFLTRIVNELTMFSVSVVFTTYKYYWSPPMMSIGEVDVDVLSVTDIMSLLQYYVPHIDDCVTYANVLVKTFCFPEAVRLIAEEYLADRNCHVTPDQLEKIINKDLDFLSRLFESRLQEVDSWVPKKDLLYLAHFKHSIENSFTEAHLEYVNSSDSDQVLLQKTISHLKKNHLVRSLPGIRRLVIHPLIVYHSMVSSSRDRQLLPEKWLDNTCNRYTCFLGRVLMSIEANMQEHGRKGLVFAGLIQEGPNIRYVFQMALHCCNVNTYQNFIKVAITASNYILKIFPREAEAFYWSLYNSAKVYGSPEEFAVMEAFLGQAIAEGTGKDWTRANQYLSSAIEHLSTFGNSYFLGWAFIRKAIIFHRQGKYEESMALFDQASDVLDNVDRWALGEQFVVPEQKVDEEMITQRIHMAIPIIFTGRNREARRHLDKILDLIQNFFENHPDIATLLNLIGLTEQRGNRNKERALMWYKLSYNERMYWAKACPESLLAVLNNIGMIYLYQENSEEAIKYLQKALAIRRECGWTHYATGLTLVHLAEIQLRTGNLVEAYKTSLEAERIFAATVKDHDMRLRVNFDLAHMRVLIRQALEPHSIAVREYLRRTQSQESCEQNERTSETRSSQGRNLRAEGNDAPTCTRTAHRKTSWDTNDDSVTSSQLFGAAGGSQQDMNAPYHHHHHRQNSQPFPAPGDILRMSAAEIEPCDLRMSAGDYFERILTITGSTQGTLSDDGLSNMLCSHEHLMLFNLGNSPEKFTRHRLALSTFSEDNPWLEVDADTDTGVDSKYRCLIKHKPLYNYVLRTPYEQLDIRTFIKHMLNACLTCSFVRNAFSVDAWETEAMHCIQEREIRQRRVPEFERTRAYHPPTQHGHAGNDTASLPACNTFEFRDSNQNGASTNIIKRHNVQPTKSDIALPVFQQLLPPDNSLEDGGRIMELHHTTVAGQSELHRKLSEMLSQPSLVLPRIANTQEEILKLIKSKKESYSPSVSMEAERCLPGTSSVCKNTSAAAEVKQTAAPDFLTSRTPVEQSYLGDQDPAWSSDCSRLLQRDTRFSTQAAICRQVDERKVRPSREAQKEMENSEQRKGHMHKETNNPRREIFEGIACGTRQMVPNNDHENIVSDLVSNTVLPGDISKSQLVLEKCRLDRTSQTGSNSGITADLDSSTHEHKYQWDSPGNQTCKTSEGGKFSVLDYLINVLKINESTQSDSPASKTCHEESQQQIQHPEQQPCEKLQVAGLQAEKLENRFGALHASSRSHLEDTRKPPLASPPNQPCDSAPYSENCLRLHVVLPDKHGQEASTENQPQQHLQCEGFNKESPDDSQNILDSILDSASMHDMNISQPLIRRSSNSDCSASSRRSRTVSSLSSTSSSHHACSHVTSTVESGYSSQQHLNGMSKTRPSGDKYHKTNCAGSHTNQAFSDIPFPCANSLPTEASHTNAMTETCGRERTQTDDLLTAQRERTQTDDLLTAQRERTQTDDLLTAQIYIKALKQAQHFPDQSLLLQSSTLQHLREEHQLPQPASGCQTYNEVVEFLSSPLPCYPVFTKTPNGPASFREPVEQSWDQTQVPNGTQPSAEATSESGYMIRQEILHLNQRRQCEHEVSADSEEVTLAENVKS